MGGHLEQIIIAFWLLTTLNIAKPCLRTEVFPDGGQGERAWHEQWVTLVSPIPLSVAIICMEWS